MESQSALHEFLKTQHAELASRLARLRSQLHQVESELAELKKAAAAIGLALPEFTPQPEESDLIDQSETVINSRQKLQSPHITMKQAAERILECAANGLTVGEILDIMKRDYDLPYPRSSLSPQLSRLKQDGIVVQKGGKWILRKFAENDLPAGTGIFG
jgi:hypothetical protein